MPRRRPHYGPVGVDRKCRFGCGAPVTVFTDQTTGQIVQLDAEPPTITTDLTQPDTRHRCWEFRGQYLGWTPMWRGQRSWRPCRLVHDCPQTPALHKPRRA